MLGAIFASGYQLAVNGNQAKLLPPDQQGITNIQVLLLKELFWVFGANFVSTGESFRI